MTSGLGLLIPVVVFVVVATSGVLAIVHRHALVRVVSTSQTRLFGSRSRRFAPRPWAAVLVGIGFVLVALAAITSVILALAFPDTFHLSG